VRICRSADEVRKEAADLFERSLTTKQTATEGITVRKVLVEKAVDIRRELYVSLSLDRELVCPVIVVCPEGGADIESVGIAQPEKIRKIPINPYTGYSSHSTRGRSWRSSDSIPPARTGSMPSLKRSTGSSWTTNACSSN
jgi:succinyl-CoA synthetase beta subunit